MAMTDSGAGQPPSDKAGTPERSAMTRRQALKGIGLSGAAFSLPAFLAGWVRDDRSTTGPNRLGGTGPATTEGGTATSTADAAVKRGGTFVMAVGIDIPEMDPHELQTFANLQMYEAPARRHPTEYGAFLPALVESVDATDDGLEYTMHLRSGVTFHDGSPFDAAAFVFSMERAGDTENEYNNGGEAWASWALGTPGIVELIEAVDDATVRVVLSQPVPDVDFIMADEQGGLGAVNPAVLIADHEHFGQEPFGAGTGPFMFEERVPGDHVTLARYENYWDEGKPYLDKWVLRVIPDPGTRVLSLKSGEVHMFDVAGPEIAQLQDDPEVQLFTVPPIFGNFIAFDHNDPVTGIREVRQAMSQAIDMASIVASLSPFATVTPNFGLYPGMPGFRDDVGWYPYDPERARALLGEAGFPDGVDITLSYSTPPIGLDANVLAQAIQGQLAESGFRVELAVVDPPTMFESSYGPPGREDFPFQAALVVNGTDGNSHGMLFTWTYRSNYSAVHPAYLERAMASNVEVDRDRRLGIYGEMQQLLYDDVAYLPLAHTEVVRAAALNVRGLETAAYHFHDVWLDD